MHAKAPKLLEDLVITHKLPPLIARTEDLLSQTDEEDAS